jgi:hypothetical protein
MSNSKAKHVFHVPIEKGYSVVWVYDATTYDEAALSAKESFEEQGYDVSAVHYGEFTYHVDPTKNIIPPVVNLTLITKELEGAK